MPAVIYTNQASLMAQKGLLGAQTSLALSVERLSSGLRINRAKDDAAGLGVGENLQKQLNGVRQGLNNVNDAISMSQTAEGALSAVAAVTQRMITLATQGANDTMSQDQRASIAKEIDKLRTSIQDMAKRTKYTDTTLFSGVSQFIQVSNNATDKITISTSALAAISVDGPAKATYASGGASAATTMVLADVTDIAVGQTITGTGVAANTTITAVDSGTKTITLSNALTAQAAGNYSFSVGAAASDSGSALNSKINVLKGTLSQKYQQLSRAEWGMNTNLHSAFDAILNVALNGKVSQENMPDYVLILSDMQFDYCVRNDDTALQMITQKKDA